MKYIQLTKGKEAIVDDEDFVELNRTTWQVNRANQKEERFYVRRMIGPQEKRKCVYMHRQILNAPKGMFVDHRNNNPLDNRRSNLRLCTALESTQHRGAWGNNEFKGVRKGTTSPNYYARIIVNKKQVHLGMFPTPQDAARAYNKAAKKYFGEFAVLSHV